MKLTTDMLVRSKTSRNLITTTFGAVVKEAREAAGLSQEVFARLALIDLDYLATLERGDLAPNLLIIFHIAEQLGKPVAVLMDETYDRVNQLGRG